MATRALYTWDSTEKKRIGTECQKKAQLEKTTNKNFCSVVYKDAI